MIQCYNMLHTQDKDKADKELMQIGDMFVMNVLTIKGGINKKRRRHEVKKMLTIFTYVLDNRRR